MTKILIVIEGGCIQNVAATEPIEYHILDLGAETPEIGVKASWEQDLVWVETEESLDDLVNYFLTDTV